MAYAHIKKDEKQPRKNHVKLNTRRTLQTTDIATDVLIIGAGPTGPATAALLSTYGIKNMVVNRDRWLANTPRAHITNRCTMPVTALILVQNASELTDSMKIYVHGRHHPCVRFGAGGYIHLLVRSSGGRAQAPGPGTEDYMIQGENAYGYR
jgi:cation diffusion facilitator CzcD-associated flavoprotein CzcO